MAENKLQRESGVASANEAQAQSCAIANHISVYQNINGVINNGEKLIGVSEKPAAVAAAMARRKWQSMAAQ